MGTALRMETLNDREAGAYAAGAFWASRRGKSPKMVTAPASFSENYRGLLTANSSLQG
jgi:hypothetical protein